MGFDSSPGIHAPHPRAVILWTALVLVLMVALPALAANAAGDSWDGAGDIANLQWGPISTACMEMIAPVLALTLLLLAVIRVPEYLSSHVGEKRLDGGADGTILPVFILSILTTALVTVPSYIYRAENVPPGTRR